GPTTTRTWPSSPTRGTSTRSRSPGRTDARHAAYGTTGARAGWPSVDTPAALDQVPGNEPAEILVPPGEQGRRSVVRGRVGIGSRGRRGQGSRRERGGILHLTGRDLAVGGVGDVWRLGDRHRRVDLRALSHGESRDAPGPGTDGVEALERAQRHHRADRVPGGGIDLRHFHPFAVRVVEDET